MGAVYDSFEKELEGWDLRYSHSPREELIALCLLALEREELVVIGYGEDLIRRRLASMPVTSEVRELIRHALMWVWRDEEMHAIYVRGALLKLGNLPLRVNTFAHQIAGAIAGWATSVNQHARWTEAPISRGGATIITAAGSVLGKVPRSVRKHLVYGPFRDFCLFNVDAERTAWLCWKRMADIAERIPELPSSVVPDFRRVQTDEDRHGAIFQILAESLTPNDGLAEGTSAETLSQRIGEVGEFFLPRSRRQSFVRRNPLGSGGKVWVQEGSNLAEKLDLFRRILDESRLAVRLRNRAEELGKSIHDVSVAIKPTFMLGYDRRDSSVITDPALIDALARYLREVGCADVAVIEARNIYDQFFHRRTVREVADYFEIQSESYRLVDGSEEQVAHSYFRGLAQYTVARSWKEADFRITFGKMRSHPVELAYLTVGNVEWIGGRCDEFLFAERQAHRETAIMMLLDEFPPHFAILDAYESAADGLIGVMGCPRPKQPLRFYAGPDALSVDIVAARHIRVQHPRKSTVLRAACDWFGDPSGEVEVVGVNNPIREWKDPYHNELSTVLSFIAFPVYVMGSGRGSMFLPDMDQVAFPLIGEETFCERISRRSVRWLIGLRRPQ